jgi:hypothetical protein
MSRVNLLSALHARARRSEPAAGRFPFFVLESPRRTHFRELPMTDRLEPAEWASLWNVLVISAVSAMSAHMSAYPPT